MRERRRATQAAHSQTQCSLQSPHYALWSLLVYVHVSLKIVSLNNPPSHLHPGIPTRSVNDLVGHHLYMYDYVGKEKKAQEVADEEKSECEKRK